MRSNPGLKNNPWVCIPYVVGVDVALARQQRFVSHHLSPLLDGCWNKSSINSLQCWPSCATRHWRLKKLPSAEKHALVTARLKKPTLDLTDLNSYRPISNLSFTSKLVERCVAPRFVAHCEQNRLFPDMQSAYRRHHSTETAVLTVHNDIIQAIDRGQLTALVLLDLSVKVLDAHQYFRCII